MANDMAKKKKNATNMTRLMDRIVECGICESFGGALHLHVRNKHGHNICVLIFGVEERDRGQIHLRSSRALLCFCAFRFVRSFGAVDITLGYFKNKLS